MPDCFVKGIFERETCNEYETYSLSELLERERFVEAWRVGKFQKTSTTEPEVTLNIQPGPSSPAQRARWRRLWRLLLEDRGARPETVDGRASAQQEGPGNERKTSRNDGTTNS
jgi:hypothetical protein